MSEEVNLPQLPFPFGTIETRSGDCAVWLEGQLRAYGEACRKDELENILQTLRETRIADFSMPEQWFNNGVDAAISAIRARSTP